MNKASWSIYLIIKTEFSGEVMRVDVDDRRDKFNFARDFIRGEIRFAMPDHFFLIR